MTSRKAPKMRTMNFGEDETRLLLQLWGSPTIQNKLTYHKAPLMRLIASNMRLRGFDRTTEEVQRRIHNLTTVYRRIKKYSVGTVDPVWPYYKAMDEILNKKPSLVDNRKLSSDVANEDIKKATEDVEVKVENGADYTSNSDGNLVTSPAPKPETATGTNKSDAVPITFLILNNGQSGQPLMNNANVGAVTNLVKEILAAHKKVLELDLEKKRLQMEREKLEVKIQELENTIGSLLINMVPAFMNIFQELDKKEEAPDSPEEEAPEEEEDTKNFVEHPDFFI